MNWLNEVFPCKKEKPRPLVYEEVKLDCGYRMDLVIEKRTVVEVKSVDSLTDVHLARILTYRKLNDSRVGLLINFNILKIKESVKRIVNGY